jgi:hypothetical protein
MPVLHDIPKDAHQQNTKTSLKIENPPLPSIPIPHHQATKKPQSPLYP